MRIIAVGKLKAPFWREAADHYLRLLRKLRPVELIEVRDADASLPEKERIAVEGGRLLACLSGREMPIALDAGGKPLDSHAFARFLRQCEERAGKAPGFVIGGPFGLDASVLGACRHCLSLSPMTWPHELARVMLLEQLFRAENILRGFPYHH